MVLRHESQKPFNLLRFFAILSLLCIAVTASATAFVLSRFLADRLLERDAVVTMNFIQSMSQTGEQERYFSGPRAPDDVEGLGTFFSRVVLMPDVVRANAFSRSRMVVWSSDPGLIGRRFDDNHELDEALEGKLVREVKNLKTGSKSEHIHFADDVTDFVENYVPIWSQDRSEVVGVMELYRVPRTLFRDVRQATILVWASAVTGGIFLYATLFWIVRRANLLLREQQQKLLESETFAALGEMAGAVAHGIRNPLASIRMTAQLAIEEAPQGLREEDARDVIDEVDRLDQWVRELMQFVRLETTDPEPVQIDELIAGCLAGIQQTSQRQGVVSKLDVRETVPAIRGDARLLEQMFSGLLSNALEAMPNGGDLLVSVRPDRERVEVILTDSGSGIPPDQLDRIFKPFFTRKRNGMGLGLLLVKRILDRHGAQIELSSREHRGTTVTLRFPLR